MNIFHIFSTYFVEGRRVNIVVVRILLFFAGWWFTKKFSNQIFHELNDIEVCHRDIFCNVRSYFHELDHSHRCNKFEALRN